MLRCLTDKLDEITDEDCKKEVFYFIKMEVRDFRNDVILAEACRTDVDKHCANVEPGAPPAGCLGLLGMDLGWPAGAWVCSACCCGAGLTGEAGTWLVTCCRAALARLPWCRQRTHVLPCPHH